MEHRGSKSLGQALALWLGSLLKHHGQALFWIGLGFVFALFIDRTVYRIVEIWWQPNWNLHGMIKLLRELGTIWPWILAAITLGCLARQWQHPGWRYEWIARGWLMLLSPMLCGLLAELLKIVIRRERPLYHDGLYVFRSWTEKPLSSSGLGFPSSHSAVAFGAAWMLMLLWPKGWPVWLAIGVGCAMTRIVAGAHFLSDTYAAAVVAYPVAYGLYCWHRSRNPLPTVAMH